MLETWDTLHNFYPLYNVGDARIYVKRDDLIPFSFGGNKVRIAREICRDMEEKGCDAVISYGSPTSNLNRAVADMAAAEGHRCVVIMKREDRGAHTAQEEQCMCFNERLVRKSGAQVVDCTAKNVKETVERAAGELRQQGYRPYYVYGDSSGHGNEEVLMRAGAKISRDLWTLQREQKLGFDHIFLAVGTAVTVSGLAAGISEHCEVEEIRQPLIHGISVARPEEAVWETVRAHLASCGYDTRECLSLIRIYGDYLGGGYGGSKTGMDSGLPADFDKILEECRIRYGLPLDKTYTGKAFAGMLSEIRRQQLTGNILFVHTGGLPLVFDELR